MESPWQMIPKLGPDGFEVLAGVLPRATLAEIDAELCRIYRSYSEHDPISLRTEFRRDENGVYRLDRLDPVLDLVPALRDVLNLHLRPHLERRFAQPVTFFKCKHILKEPNTIGYTLHQDFLYWTWLELPPENLYSIMIPFADFDPAAGPIEFIRGANDALVTVAQHGKGGDLQDADYAAHEARVPIVHAGDALLFDSLVPHRSGPNHSAGRRSVVIVSVALQAIDGLYDRYYERELKRRAASFANQLGDECFRDIGRRISV